MDQSIPRNIDNVFGLHRGDTLHYIEREGVDLNFVESIFREKHVSIFGCSKQGKTTLRKKHLGENQYILVTCDPGWTVEDLHASILKEAGCVISTGKETQATSDVGAKAEVGARIKVPFFEYDGKLGTNGRQATTTTETFDELPIDLADPRQIVDVLKQASPKTIIVIEEFHYLPERTQRQFAFKMKTFHEISDYIFIVVGVWLEENRLVVLNSDLGGRIDSINADMWSREDLRRVIVDGGKLLNVSFPEIFVDQLLNEAANSVYVVRETCYRTLKQYNIYNRQDQLIDYQGDASVKAIVKGIADGLSDYHSFVHKLSRRSQDSGFFWKIVIFMLASATPQDLQNGLSTRKLRASLARFKPELSSIKDSQIRPLLSQLGSLQKKSGLPVIFDYDRSDDRTKITDKGFILWRKTQKKDDLMEMVLEPSQIY